MLSTVLAVLALAPQASALVAPRAPLARCPTAVFSSPPLSYAADKAKDAPEEEITDASFVGQYLCTNQP